MLKRTIIFVFILSALALLAMAPMGVPSVSENNLKRQETVEPTVTEPTAVEPTVVEPTVEITVDPGITLAVETPTATPGVVPVTGNNDPTDNTLTYALLAIIGLAVIVGGVALINRRQI